MSLRWTEEDLQRYQARVVSPSGRVSGKPTMITPRKYGNKPTLVDGIRFDSQAEAKRYGELKLLELAGQIIDLEWHRDFPLSVLDIVIGKYVADFCYLDQTNDGALVVEDVKGGNATKTPLYRWKKKHFAAEYRIDIREIS